MPFIIFSVFITIGAEKPPPDALKNARYCAPQSPKPASQSVYNKFSKGEFTVSWCHLSSVSQRGDFSINFFMEYLPMR